MPAPIAAAAAAIAARPAAPNAAAVIAFGRIAPSGPGAVMARYARNAPLTRR